LDRFRSGDDRGERVGGGNDRHPGRADSRDD
jgi:hypothetical protein